MSSSLSPSTSPISLPRGRRKRAYYWFICILLSLLALLFPSEITKSAQLKNGGIVFSFNTSTSVRLNLERGGTQPIKAGTDANADAGSSARGLSAMNGTANEALIDNNTTLSLVTSFWADSPAARKGIHRQEMEGAMLNNINNPHFDQVIVFLDGANWESNCTHFKDRMKQLLQEFNEKMGGNLVHGAYHQNSKKGNRPVLDCVNIRYQPHYHELFNHATGGHVTGEIVIVANADQAFDDTVRWAKYIKQNTILVLPTWGFHKDATPSPVKEHFRFVLGNESKGYQQGISNKCNDYETKSWDSYVFPKKLLQGRVNRESFMRKTTNKRKLGPFLTNEPDAERAALWGLMQSTGDVGGMDFNGCSVIRSWHLHDSPNFHMRRYGLWHQNSAAKSHNVPGPYRLPANPIQDAFASEPVFQNVPTSYGSKPVILPPAKPGSLSLVTSYWAQPPEEQSKNTLHRLEIEVTILNNLNNPYFDQVVVILDGATTSCNCLHFKERMAEHAAKYNQFMGIDVNSTDYKSQKRAVLDCVDVWVGQPNYFDMFMYATNPGLITSEIVIVANADQAFDESVQWAKHIKNTTVLALPTWGLNMDRVPSPTKDHFIFIHGTSSTEYKTEIPPRCKEGEKSWDAYVFHRKLVAGRLHPESFKRPTVHWATSRRRDSAFFKMNEMGGENAGLWALMEGLPEAMDVNGCTVIQTWHFHGAPKMHAHELNEEYWYWDRKDPKKYGFRVPRPYRLPALDSANVTASFSIAPPQKAALQLTPAERREIKERMKKKCEKKVNVDARAKRKKLSPKELAEAMRDCLGIDEEELD
ncbi:expressed unknown protein [Seminavis robusta]|uniref:Uncharacterized protein n=1 Tax=Seminavis robusta TaxID=568900 RepID=A0A9N8DGD3_9STRA|nr:expressed unknown protein [Seminavis robusta]|eukprot:Sro138_g064790.1 n/a (813) ;mRNA; r:65720-68158